MIPYSRPKLSDLYTVSQRKLLENYTLFSRTYLYSLPYMAVPPPPGCFVGIGTKKIVEQRITCYQNLDTCKKLIVWYMVMLRKYRKQN